MSDDTGDSTKTIGPILQEARTAKSLTIEAAAAASKVPLSYVRLMEQEQFYLVPDPLYLIRFLTEYATFLGLDPKQVEAQLKEQVNSARVSESSHSVSSTGSQIDLRRLLIYLLPAAAVIPLIFIGLSLFSGSPPPMPPAQTTPLPSAETTTPPTEGLPAAPPSLQTTAPQVQEPQGPPSRYRLRAEAQAMTWLAVSADGAPRREVLLRAGETAQWSANNRFTVTIGNPRGVALSLNGRPVSLKGEPDQVIRDLALPGDGGPPLAGQ
jgi:cytoskeletal protein RodZ